ncbi:unnamed protein product [Haemonchus placei]|uniref:C2H2-type domain-containing protein n=1 Tax=Haemonchus placei TaxID=6290 RepID=A0A0N4VTU2_HAEPC|nr:unnamed protein product [Haemonchus placei]
MPPKSEEQAFCHICETMVLRRNLYRRMSDVHKYTQDEIKRMKDDYRKESQSRASKLTVSCPACGDRFVDHEHLASHCANGAERNYTVYSLTFQTKDEFEVRIYYIGFNIIENQIPLGFPSRAV